MVNPISRALGTDRVHNLHEQHDRREGRKKAFEQNLEEQGAEGSAKEGAETPITGAIRPDSLQTRRFPSRGEEDGGMHVDVLA